MQSHIIALIESDDGCNSPLGCYTDNTQEQQRLGSGAVMCSCERDCPADVIQVCGSDGKVYDNECLMEEAACQGDVYLEVMHQEYCFPGESVLSYRVNILFF